MNQTPPATIPSNRRILLIDDNMSIHEDFKKILCGEDSQGLDASRSDLFADASAAPRLDGFTTESAFQGQEGLQRVEQSLAEGNPYAMAFVDMRMPPGWDGVETIGEIWKADPDLQVVICTAYSDYSLEDMVAKLGWTDRFVILKKPFDNVEVLQLSNALTEKWRLLKQSRSHVNELEQRVRERTQELESSNTHLQAEIIERRRAEAWLAAEKDILECLASNMPLSESLELVARKLEALSGGFVCSILLLDTDGIHLRHCAAPSLAAAYNKAIDGIVIGPDVGSCGTAAHDRRQVIVADIASDPLWKNFRDLALGHGLRSCWSNPVLSPTGQVLGTFALYYSEVREPSPADLELVRRATSLVSVALNRHRAEGERIAMEIQLRHAQKLESIGQLAAGIAHEINTPTQYIGDNTRFVRDACSDLFKLVGEQNKLLAAARTGTVSPEVIAGVDAAAKTADLAYLTDEIPRAIDQSLDGVDRVTKIVRAMKEFSHPGSTDKTPIALEKAIESTLTVCRSEWKFIADLVTEFDPALPPVPVLPGEFNQIILNIVVNASHAIADVVGDGAKGKGTITVSTRRDGDWAEIRIGDSGTGIPEKAREKLFEPFFTTKGVGKGTGQGLAIARSVVVDKHGGTIHFETEMGKGTTFVIRLPLVVNDIKEKKAA